jgi:hypothetical protein
MILASTTDTILASPVISVILGGMGTGIAAILVGIFRVLSRLQSIETDVGLIGKAVAQLQHDMDVIKWGAVAGAALTHPQYPPQTLEPS